MPGRIKISAKRVGRPAAIKAPLDPLLENFLEMLQVERGASANTVDAYRRDLLTLHNFLSKRRRALADAQPDDLQLALRTLAKSATVAAASQARHLSAWRQFYKFLLGLGKIKVDPMAALTGPKLPRRLPNYLTTEQMQQLLTAVLADRSPEGKRLACLFEILYAAGLRVSELVSLPLAAVTRGQQWIKIRGKGNKERAVPLTPAAAVAIAEYLAVRDGFLKNAQPSAYLFPTRAGQGYLTRQRFAQLLKELASKAGLPKAALSPHVVRHAFATHLLEGGMDLRSLQQMLGHADIATTQIYTHIGEQRLQSTVANFHPLAKKPAKAAV